MYVEKTSIVIVGDLAFWVEVLPEGWLYRYVAFQFDLRSEELTLLGTFKDRRKALKSVDSYAGTCGPHLRVC